MTTAYLIITAILWAFGVTQNIKKNESAVAVITFALFVWAVYCLSTGWGVSK